MGRSHTPHDAPAGKPGPYTGRRVVMTGASGAFGAPLRRLLEEAGAHVTAFRYGKDYTYGHYEALDAALAQADLLVLAHGSKFQDAMEANCTSFVALIERFKALSRARGVRPEVWAVGSEIEAHPHFGVEELKVYKASKVAFARHARRYFREPELVYRHIVPSAFTSPMGKGLISGERAARWAFALIRRGFRYVPVSYTGVAWANYLKFLFGVNVAPPPATSTRPASR